MNFEPEDFYFKTPIYKEVRITPNNWNSFTHLIQFQGKVEGYNPIKKINTTFVGNKKVSGKIENGNMDSLFLSGGIFTLSINCLRYDDEITFFVKYVPLKVQDEDGDLENVAESGTLIKIGQNPSLLEFELHNVKKYTSVLSKQKQKEFVRAIGLTSHGVGIGAFVYLRRIFEELIEEAHFKAKNEKNWNDKKYSQLGMDKKIKLLKSFLPNFLVDNKNIYSILSKGIHELDEETCLKYFDTIKFGIERILDEKLDEIKKRKMDKEAKLKINTLNKWVE